ncbi:MAG: LamG domain-containing protein, partial [Candidatus Aminicenantes bacterium]|nr:LamG domain-containing protein [Candidatus Aminicenantes bacterium]
VAYIAYADHVTLLSLTDLTQPQVTGSIPSIGGRLAFGENGALLFGTAKSAWGGDTELGGVRTAALGNLTYITKAPTVIVDVDGASIEPQPISYRALFPRDQVETAEVEITDDGVVRERLEAALDENGAGEVSLPTGTAHSLLKARLVINRGKPAAQRPLATERILKAGSFEVEASEQVVPADSDPVLVTAINEALQKRLAAESAGGTRVVLPQFTWHVTGPTGATVDPGVQSVADTGLTGLYTTSFVPSGTAGAVHRVELRVGDRVLGRSVPIQVEAGKAYQGQIEMPMARLPADGKASKLLRIYDLKDRFGNRVPDGRKVTWLAQAPLVGQPGGGQHALLPGAFKSATTIVINGEATNEYVAGAEPGWVRLAALADDEFRREFQVFQAPLTVDLEVTGPGPVPELQRELILLVRSEPGAQPDGTPIGWGVTAGYLEAQPTLTGSVAQATFTWPLDPKTLTVGIPQVFATVGRSRAVTELGIANAEEPSVGLFLRLLGRRLLGDVSDGSSSEVGADLSVPSQLALQVRGGTPGQVVHLTLDSYRQPDYLPVKHYTFDELTDGLTPDLVGGAPAAVGEGVAVEYGDAAEGAGSVRVSGGDGITVSAANAFSPSGDFGISGYVRLEAEGSQTIVSRSGSYGIAAIDVGGQTHLEFTVMNDGTTRQVVSAEPLVPGSWTHFAARLQDGRLQLLLGDGGIVKVGDLALPPDDTNAPLVMGGVFDGKLDEVAFFDLTRRPNVVFENGKPTIDVTLNGEGWVELFLRSQGMFAGVPLGALARYGEGSVRIWELPVTGEDWIESWTRDPNEAMRQRYGTYVTQMLNLCGEGIADGESGGAVGAACDLILGIGSMFTPAGAAVNLAQSARDTVVSTKNFIDGKSRTASAVKGTISVFGIVAASLNPVARVAKLGKRSLQVLEGIEAAQRVTLREALEVFARKVADPEAVLPKLLEILGDETGSVAPRARQALIRLLTDSEDVGQLAISLERLGKVYDYEKLLGSLDNVLAEVGPKFGPDVQKQLGRGVVLALDEIALSAPAGTVASKLSDEAMKGMAVLVGHGSTRGWKANRVLRIWDDLGHLEPNKQVQGFQDMMQWIAEGDRRNIKGWVEFLANGPGTSAGLLGRNNTKGAYATLQYLNDVQKWKDIVELERPLGRCRPMWWLAGLCRFERYVDIVAHEADAAGNVREVFKEIKNLREGASFGFGSQVKFDVNKVLQESLNLNGGRLVETDLVRRLGQLEYVLRGSPEEMAAVMSGLAKRIESVLSALEAQHLAKHVKITPLSLPLPI